jgi:YgiT-type zinc finger domain-containing protein
MKCQVCGARMKAATTNLPFKITEHTIVIVKNVRVLQCSACSEYLIQDNVMKRVDEVLQKADRSAELEVVTP